MIRAQKTYFFSPSGHWTFMRMLWELHVLPHQPQPLTVLPNKGQIFQILCFSWACSNHKSVIRNHVHIARFVFIIFWTEYKHWAREGTEARAGDRGAERECRHCWRSQEGWKGQQTLMANTTQSDLRCDGRNPDGRHLPTWRMGDRYRRKTGQKSLLQDPHLPGTLSVAGGKKKNPSCATVPQQPCY